MWTLNLRTLHAQIQEFPQARREEFLRCALSDFISDPRVWLCAFILGVLSSVGGALAASVARSVDPNMEIFYSTLNSMVFHMSGALAGGMLGLGLLLGLLRAHLRAANQPAAKKASTENVPFPTRRVNADRFVTNSSRQS